MSRADSDAIYAYLMAQKPAAVANHEPELSFPFNMRFAVMFWNMLFLQGHVAGCIDRGSSR